MANLDEFKAMYASQTDEYNDLTLFGLALEDELLADGVLNQYAHRARDLSQFIARVGCCIQSGAATKRVLRNVLDERAVDGNLNLPAGYDLRAAAIEYVKKCKPHWQPAQPAPLDGLAARAFGLDGTTPTLKAQGEYLKEECGGSTELFNQKAAEFGHPGIGRLVQGQRPSTDKTAKLPPAASALRDNPWLAGNDDARAMARRVEIIKVSTKLADSLSRKAGKTVSGAPRGPDRPF